MSAEPLRVPLGRREELRLTVEVRRREAVVSFEVSWCTPAGFWEPTKSHIAIPLGALPAVRAALETVERLFFQPSATADPPIGRRSLHERPGASVEEPSARARGAGSLQTSAERVRQAPPRATAASGSTGEG